MNSQYETNLAAKEEIEALKAIYADEFFTLEPENRIYAIEIRSPDAGKSVKLHFEQVPNYPKAPLKFELHAPWLDCMLYENLSKKLSSIIDNTRCSPIVHELVEAIRTFLEVELNTAVNEGITHSLFCQENAEDTASTSALSVRSHLKASPGLLSMAVGIKCPEIYHGEPFVDRKSVFQAHLARVYTVGEVSCVISQLLTDRKIASATHNILAWRVQSLQKEKPFIISDCDDDGETNAGSRLLHLLTITQVANVAIVVTRWYGGIHLGPDRFKHINNLARLLLIQYELINDGSKTQGRNVTNTGKPGNQNQTQRRKRKV